jgi:hypothetical protein
MSFKGLGNQPHPSPGKKNFQKGIDKQTNVCYNKTVKRNRANP